MKKQKNLKQKIIFYVMSVALLVTVLITTIMSVGSIRSTNNVLLDNMQITARTASQNIMSNLHLLTERMYNFSTETVFLNDTISETKKQKRFDAIKNQIEFLWLSAYDTDGKKLYGDTTSPKSITNTKYFSKMTETENLVIGEPYYNNTLLQLCVGAPLKNKDGEIKGYLVGSYKYDLIDDVLSQLVLGNTGSACILNEDGDIIGDRNKQNIIEKKNIYKLYPSSANASLFKKITSYQIGSAEMKLGSKHCYTGYSPIPGTNWELFLHVPKNEFMDTVYMSVIVSILLSIALIIAAGAVIIPVARKISNPLSAATKRLQALADGNLTKEVLLSDSNDETKILTDALAKTIASLKSYIQDIETSLSALSDGDFTIDIPNTFRGDFSSIQNSLDNITDSLNRTMQQMSKSSVEVSECAKQLLDGSKQQNDLLHSMEENMAAITSSIEKNKEHVLQIEQCAEMANQKTALGGSYMQNMLDSMSQIHKTVDEISNISLMMESISRETNLLSLNAAIEASRAGEAGRGFAVVANEIGSLSKQTTDALLESSNLISRSAEAIRAGLETAGQTADTFREIADLTTQYYTISNQLSDTVKDQTDAVAYAEKRLISLQEIAGKNDEMAAESLSQAKTLRNFVAQVKIKQPKMQ
ncbi:MAG: methyl-accepting chemotaxis protein [Lachnospiraceae bacterium]|nr:methyl-accepting chemotaxis protein [Lachnospiraceae bacterium]